MARRLHQTMADYVVIAISPALIMALVGSLVFFLLNVFYQGQFAARLHWVMACFVFAAVLIARISIEEGLERAMMFGVALAIPVGIASMKFIELQGTWVDSFGWLINWGLIALIWWCAHRLTWDCTVIDDDQDASGQGLMQTTGLERDHKTAQEAALDEQRLEGTTSRKVQAGWWQRYLEQQKQPHAPGVWVVYFSLAALPLFGIGQWFIPAEHVGARRYAFWLLCVYVNSGMGLLLTTSFLGLRRYLRQRRIEMPTLMANLWLGTGAILIAALLLLAALLPRPSAEYAISELPFKIGSPDAKSSRKAMLREDATQDAEPGSAAGEKPDEEPKSEGESQPSEEASESSDKSGTEGKSDSQSQPSNQDGSQADGKSGQSGNSKQGNQAGKQGSSSGQSKQSDGKGQSQGSKSSSKSQSNEKQKSDAANKQPNRSQRGQQPDSQQQPDDNANTQSDDAQQRQSDDSDNSQAPEPPQETPTFPDVITPVAGLADIFKWVFYGIVVLVVLYVLWRARAEVLRALREFLSALRDLLSGLWGGKRRAKSAADDPQIHFELPPAPFSSFADPFATGIATRYSTEELVRYSFEAFEAWSREHGTPRTGDQTPHELARDVAKRQAFIAAEARNLAELYSRAAYARGELPPTTRDQLRELWQKMRSQVTRLE